MKWAWVLYLMCFFPVAAMAEQSGVQAIADHEWNVWIGKDAPYTTRFAVSAVADVEQVRARMRVFADRNIPVNDLNQGRCVLILNEKPIEDMHDFLIHGPNGPELWLSHLKKKEGAVIAIVWNHDSPKMSYSTIDVESAQGIAHAQSVPTHTEWLLDTIPFAERPNHFRELSLDDVCETFTTEAFKGFEYPKS